MDFEAVFKKKNDELREKLLFREPKDAEVNGVKIIRNGKEFINFSSNDYLGLNHHPEVIAAGIKATEKYGSGAGASRLITGNHPLYDELEAEIAGYYGTEAAAVFGSGYMANIGAISAILDKNDLCIVDKLSHACIIDGAALSEAKFLRFKHNDVQHLEKLLGDERKNYRNCLIITEGVFSMDGDKGKLEELAEVAKKYDAWLMVDNAHALEKVKVKPEVIMGTLSKAFASYGGFIAGGKEFIAHIKSCARSFVFTTGLPPSVIASAVQVFKILKVKPEILQKPVDMAKYFISQLDVRIQPQNCQSQIVPIILGDVERTLKVQKILEEKGMLVHAIRPPTVAPNSARLRVSITALHKQEMLSDLAKILNNLEL